MGRKAVPSLFLISQLRIWKGWFPQTNHIFQKKKAGSCTCSVLYAYRKTELFIFQLSSPPGYLSNREIGEFGGKNKQNFTYTHSYTYSFIQVTNIFQSTHSMPYCRLGGI